MKKLKLNVANLEATEILTREELKRVLGGTGSGSGSSSTSCSTTCKGSSDIEITDCVGTCTSVNNTSVTCTGPTATLTKTCPA